MSYSSVGGSRVSCKYSKCLARHLGYTHCTSPKSSSKFFSMFSFAYVTHLRNKDSWYSLGDNFFAFLFWANTEFGLTYTPTTISTGVVWVYLIEMPTWQYILSNSVFPTRMKEISVLSVFLVSFPTTLLMDCVSFTCVPMS